MWKFAYSLSLCAAGFPTSDFLTWWLSSRGSSGITPTFVLAFFLSDKLKQSGLVLLLAKAPTPRGCSLGKFYHLVPSAKDAIREYISCFSKASLNLPPAQLQQFEERTFLKQFVYACIFHFRRKMPILYIVCMKMTVYMSTS